VTQRSGLLPKRTFLAAARRGAFRSFRIGKDRYARIEDVIAFIEAAPSPPPKVAPVVAKHSDELGHLLDVAGTRRAGG
jgi:hypothetical protein